MMRKYYKQILSIDAIVTLLHTIYTRLYLASLLINKEISFFKFLAVIQSFKGDNFETVALDTLSLLLIKIIVGMKKRRRLSFIETFIKKKSCVVIMLPFLPVKIGNCFANK